MELSDDVGRIATAAARFAEPGEEVSAVLAVELVDGERLYLCAFANAGATQTWVALDDDGSAITDRKRVHDAASIAALVEVAEETADFPADKEPRVASLSYLDSFGADGGLTGAIQSALPAVDELARDIEGNYKLELD